MAKLNYSICWFAAQDTFLIITNVENSFIIVFDEYKVKKTAFDVEIFRKCISDLFTVTFMYPCGIKVLIS